MNWLQNPSRFMVPAALIALMLSLVPAKAQPTQALSADIDMPQSWLNGRLFQVSSIRDARDPVQVIEDYHQAWGRDSQVRLIRASDETWQVLTRLAPHAIETLRVKADANGTFGYITRWQLSQSQPLFAHTVGSLLPDCTRVINEFSTRASSSGLAGTITAHSCLRSNDVERALRGQLKLNGYVTEPSDDVIGLIRASRGLQSLVATISSASTGSQLVLYVSRAAP
jgi:hypothetical protein